MKVEIKRIVKANGDHFFSVYKEGLLIMAAYFEPEAGKDCYISETNAYERALSTAKAIESGNYKQSETIVYQSEK